MDEKSLVRGSNGGLVASEEKARQAVEYALSRFGNMQPGEERGDSKFVEALSIKTFLDSVLAGYMDSVAQDQLVALASANDGIVTETQLVGEAIRAEDMRKYIGGMSGLVGRACQAVGLATKVQAAKQRDFDGYKAELGDSALQLLDGARQKYVGREV